MSDLPQVPNYADVKAARSAFQKAQEAFESAREQMHQAVITLGIQTGDDAEIRTQAIRYLYWCEDHIQTNWIAEAFGIKPSKVASEAGPIETDVRCRVCQTPFWATSKTDLKHLQWLNATVPGHRCEECNQKEHERLAQAAPVTIIRLTSDDGKRKQELRSMPYQEYLKTPEWEARRKRHLRDARYRCQVCNAGNTTLDVHHRTYEHRGNENFRDLIVLCRDCHTLFSKNGKLAKG